MTITVTALSTTAVKATRIHPVAQVTLDDRGALGDREFYLVDGDGAMVNGKRLGWLHQVVADYDAVAETLSLSLPDGQELRAPVRLGPELSTTFFGEPRAARALEGPWSAALSELAGGPLTLVRGLRGPDRGLEGAVSLVSRGSLRRLAEADDGTAVDARRFRMLIEIDGVDAHEEDSWIDREITVGATVLRPRGHVGRCVTTTRSPDTGEVTLPTLKLLGTYRQHLDTTEPLAFGIHAEVVRGGEVCVGDPVTVAPRPTT